LVMAIIFGSWESALKRDMQSAGWHWQTGFFGHNPCQDGRLWQ
jgi:hypothetical protein